MSEHLKVLHVVYNLIRGGTEGQCARLVLELARRDVAQRVAVFAREGFFVDAVERACGPVHEIRIRRMISVRTASEVLRLARFIAREEFDLVHAWDADAAVFGGAAAGIARAPLITSRRDLGQIYRPYKLRLMRLADRAARAVVVNADAIRRYVVGLGIDGGKVVRIPNLLDLREYDDRATAALPAAVQLPEGRLVTLVARLDPEKDVETFVRAAALLKDRFRDAAFVVVGDGPERLRLESLSKTLGGRVVFLGETPHVPAILKRSAVGVLVPRANEGLSNSILEYMAAGLPVVATDCGGNRELVESGVTGRLVPVGDISATAEAIAGLLAESAQARSLGQTGRSRVEREFSRDAMADRMLELYHRVGE